MLWVGSMASSLCAQTPQGNRIVTAANFTPDELVRDIFAAGACETITNIRAIGNRQGIGYFENGAPTVNLDRGIILSTGPIGHAAGPNDAVDKSGDLQDNSGDPDLNLLATAQVFDDVGLEFDFVPLDSFVTFRYVFASEEYCEFVGSVYNDVFGFFIRGPGISGGFTGNARNVALIPGSDAFVAINSVNHHTNAQYFVRNDRNDDAARCNIPAANSPFLPFIEYDGFTTVLTAVLRLQPCATYHIRLVVCDVGDQHFDSAVFLEAGSFNLGGAVGVTAHWPPDLDGLAEGCDDAYFRFTRQDDNLSFPLSVNFNLLPTGTATEGTDFVPLPRSVTIPAGQASVQLPVTAILDNLDEGPESIRLELDIPCACYSDSTTLWLVEPPPLQLTLPDAWLCPGGDGSLQATATGGRPPYTYAWDNGQTSPLRSITATDAGLYFLTVSDACGHTAIDTSARYFTQPPTALLSGQAEICFGDTAWLPVSLTGLAPWQLTYAIDGVPQPRLVNILAPNYRLAATSAGQYTIIQVQDLACQNSGVGAAQVQLMTITATAEIQDASCHDHTDGALAVTLAGGTPPYSLQWSQGLPPAQTHTGLAPGAYTLTVSDARQCQRPFTWLVSAPEALQMPLVDCTELAAGQLSFPARGGTPPYRYQVDGQPATTSWWTTLTPGLHYDLHVEDTRGCQLQAEWLMPAAYPQGMAQLPGPLTLALGASYPLSPTWLIPTELLASYRWAPPLGLSCTDCPNPLLTATTAQTYALYLTDLWGCTDTLWTPLRVEDRVDLFVPNAFSPNGDDHNDLLQVFGNPLQILHVERFQVFDRWGGLLFEARQWPINSNRHGWDGTARGQPLDTGVYVYVAQVRLLTGALRTVGGSVTLLR